MGRISLTKMQQFQIKKLRKSLAISILLFTTIFIFMAMDIHYLKQTVLNKNSTIQSEAIVIRDLRTRTELLQEENKNYDYMKFVVEATLYHDRIFSETIQSAFIHAKENKLNPFLVLSIIYVESRFNPNARSPVAYGLMQINYEVWKDELKIDFNRIYEIDYNINLGCKIFKKYFDESNDISTTLYRYCNGYMTRNVNASYPNDVLRAKFTNKLYSPILR